MTLMSVLGPISTLIYNKLIDVPEPDFVVMKVLADALEEEGDSLLAATYRWAAEHGKYPWLRQQRGSIDAGNVYDWDRDNRGAMSKNMTLPRHCLLPANLYLIIKNMKNKRYGDINDAFFLLARALEILPTLEQEEKT